MKNILFISPDFFSYKDYIICEMKRQGYRVNWFSDRPSSNILSKCILRVNRKLLKKQINNYFYNEICFDAKINNYDYVFVILGQSFNKKMMNDLKNILPNATFILYLWDSITNFPYLLELSESFDKVFSFDKNDCKEYNFEFLPLFYIFDKNECPDNTNNFDLSFVSTIKKGKLSYLSVIKESLDTYYEKNYYYLYLQSPLVYFYNKLFNKEFKKYKLKDFNYKRIEYDEYIKDICMSNIVLDIPMKNQDGLSIRTFECLGLNKKIITTNKDILNYDFYKPENIYIYNGNKIDFDDVFFKKGYVELDNRIISKYALSSWIKNIFKEE